MPNSGTYSFAPNIGDLVLDAFSRCQVKRTELTPQHITDAKLAANFIQITWSNDGITLWTVDQQTIPLVQGTSTYIVPTNTVMITDLYIVASGAGNRLILPFSVRIMLALTIPHSKVSLRAFGLTGF